MVWTDGIFVTPQDLQRVDSEILSVATTEKINLSGDYGVLRGAIEESSQELMKMVVSYGGYLSSGDISPNHLSAVLNIGLGNSIRSKVLLSQVIISGIDSLSWNHIKQWAVHRCLMYFYRDAFNRTVKDRYEGKMRYYKSEIDRSLKPSIMGLGIPMIIQPLARPGATWERSPVDYSGSLLNPFGNVGWASSGTFGTGSLSVVSASGTLGGNFDVVITYVNQGTIQSLGQFQQDYTKYVSFSQNGNAESSASEVGTLRPQVNQAIQVDISKLRPPNGIQDPKNRIVCVILPLGATGWNVYAGPHGGELTLQNSTPISIATQQYTFPGDPTTTGIPVGPGQFNDRILSLTPARQRA